MLLEKIQFSLPKLPWPFSLLAVRALFFNQSSRFFLLTQTYKLTNYRPSHLLYFKTFGLGVLSTGLGALQNFGLIHGQSGLALKNCNSGPVYSYQPVDRQRQGKWTEDVRIGTKQLTNKSIAYLTKMKIWCLYKKEQKDDIHVPVKAVNGKNLLIFS